MKFSTIRQDIAIQSQTIRILKAFTTEISKIILTFLEEVSYRNIHVRLFSNTLQSVTTITVVVIKTNVHKTHEYSL